MGGKIVDVVDWEMVEVVVDGQGTSVVELVGPVPVVGGVVEDEVAGKSVVVVPGATVVVVAAVVVVVPDGGPVGHPNDLASDANTVPAPGKLPNAACSDCSNRQIGSRMDASSCDTTGSFTTCVDPAAGMPRRSSAHTRRHSPLRRRPAHIA